MFSSGYFTVGQVRGAPVRFHWSAPLGAIAFTGFSISPALWAGWLLLVVLHELGHAALVHRFGYEVTAVRVHAFGGDCQWSGDPTRAEVAVVAWGGVLAQGLLWVAATVMLSVFGPPTSPILSVLAFTFTSTNARMLLFNLLPIPPLDGHKAWPLFGILWEARKEQRAYQRERAAQQREKERDVARAKAHALEREIAAMDATNKDPPPMPPELKAMLDRITAEVGHEERSARKRDSQK
jgi:stage IV sporulation protein FB